MKIALAQLNPIVGDFASNTRLACDAIRRAEEMGADLVVLPEMITIGYPPRDLLLREDIVTQNLEAVDAIAQACRGIAAVVGYVDRNASGRGLPLYNSAAFCAGGRIVSRHHKSLLPNYDVFDERRYFEAASQVCTCRWEPPGSEALRLGITICEDWFNNEQFMDRPLYISDPVEKLAAQGVDLMINISASPFWAGKQAERVDVFARQVREHRTPLVYVNQVGGQDELIFDGASVVLDADGQVVAQAKAFCEQLLVVDLKHPDASCVEAYPDELDSLVGALVLGTRDYVRKCGFKEVVLGVSGGIDSAVATAIAAEALSPQAVHGVAMPSRFSSEHSLSDAEALARNLGIDYRVIPIGQMHEAAEATLAPQFGSVPADVTEENIQARIRGQILMALSNKFGWLLLTTGNKSELAVGYCTLYGDMCGGLAVLSDVCKTSVYKIAKRINARASREIIPARILTKIPSAELKPDQSDQDTLPPYELLDEILSRYVERHEPLDEIVRAGFDRELVADIAAKVDRNEYKRRQAPPGLKVSSRAFGVGWRMPLAAHRQQGCT